VLGTIVLVLVLGGLMSGVLVAIEGVSARNQAVDRSTVTLNAYLDVQRAVANEVFAEAGYRRAPGRGSRDRAVATIATLNAAVNAVHELRSSNDDPSEGGVGDYLFILDARYERLVRASLWGTDSRLAESSSYEVGPALDAMAPLVDGAVARHEQIAAQAANEQRRQVRELWLLAPAALAAAMAATGLCWAMILVQHGRLRGRAEAGEFKALHDTLTGLGNRALLAQELRADLDKPYPDFALLMVDLDHFKEINDGYGHSAGDDVLRVVAERLQEVSGPLDVVCRMGGDEFAVLVRPASATGAVAADIGTCLQKPILHEGVELRTSGSVGRAVARPGQGERSILTEADDALYTAKHYSGRDPADVMARLRTVQELRTALDREQFVVHYQPKVDLDTGEVHDLEALVRWDHPTRGLVYPDAFIDLVEQFGLMPALTRNVLSQALDQVADWAEQGRVVTVAVNLSASALNDATLPELVTSMLAAQGVPAHALQLELTEEFLMVDRDRGRAILDRLREVGIQISIDDFGTGYSALSYLRDLPIDELKLDHSFIYPMADDARAAALVAAAISLAHSLGLRIVAEGVETSVAYEQLRRLGCDQAQGNFMCRPVPAAELDHWLDGRATPTIRTRSSTQPESWQASRPPTGRR
jgi:diguanylate cyclase (GGDEF)-like protein